MWPEDADPRSELEQACDKLSKWQLLNHALGREEDLREVQLADVTEELQDMNLNGDASATR